MKQNLVVRHGKIGETLKYGLLVLFVALISACGGGGGGGAISVATPDNGGESVSPTTIESQISSQLSAMEDAIEAADELSDDERADYKSVIEGLRSDLAAKEMSIEVLMKQLSEIQQQLQELISALPPEESCENEQHYIDGSCKNCPLGMAFDFNRSECVATASSCGAIGQVYADGRCQECRLGTAFSDNECIATEDFCENEQHYIDGSCKNCPPGLAFDFNRSECVATASSCGAIEQVLEGDGCRACESGLKFSDNECIATEESCENEQHYIDGSCKNCPLGMAFDFNRSECVATASSCGAIEQVLEGDGCRACAAGLEFRNNKCIATASYCHAQEQVLEGDSCRACASGLEFSRNRCVPTASYCHAQEQRLVGRYCRDCPRGQEFSNNECVVTASSCGTIERIYADGKCQSCESGTEFSDNKCIPTAASCHAKDQILEDERCQECELGLVGVKNKCVATVLSCGAIERISADGSCQECPPGTAFNNNQCIPTSATVGESLEFCNAHGLQYSRSPQGDFYCKECPYTHPKLSGNSCVATVESCNAINNVLLHEPDRCERCPAERPWRQGNICSATAEMSVATCNANNQILVGDICESCAEGMRARGNQCVVRSEFDTAEYRLNPGYEDMRISYAYERGYFGQGVTVAIIHQPGYAINHPDLAANYITASIAGISDFRLTATVHTDAARVAGFIGATRNGVGMHGIAPEVKMVPLPHGRVINEPGQIGRITSYLRESNIPIITNIESRIHVRKNEDPAVYDFDYRAKSYNDFVGDSDAIWVWTDLEHGAPLAPLVYPHLQTLWLSAISVDENKNLRLFSSACRAAKDWCVGASVHREQVSTIYGNSYRWLEGYVGGGYRYSFAAARVSGALALLYGALGIESPQMARAILLTTATDLGDPGVDEIYGHGLVNISAGIAMVENLKTAAAAGLSAVSFADLRGELPSGFSHLHNELSAVQVAIKLTNGLHYNVALSEMLTPGNDSDVPLGDGATDMLADSESNSRRGFFAYGDIDSELGLRYYGGEGGFRYIAEGQHAKTNQRFFAGDFGALGGVSGKVYSGKVGFVRDINMAGMQIFGDYERAAVGGDGDEGNLIVGVRDAQAESWMAGLSFGDIWKYGDKIKLSARQEMGLSGGDLIVRYPHAVGDFHETFIGEGTQEIEVREAFLPLKQKALMLYTAGYAQQFTAKSEWAAALEYNAGNNAKALSLIWQGEF